MRVLVLGGYGLIGLPAILKLVGAGHEVTGLGRSVKTIRISYPEVAWIEQDIARLRNAADWLPDPLRYGRGRGPLRCPST
jgi:nucleoside-diphosphate-sugar epimerase